MPHNRSMPARNNVDEEIAYDICFKQFHNFIIKIIIANCCIHRLNCMVLYKFEHELADIITFFIIKYALIQLYLEVYCTFSCVP